MEVKENEKKVKKRSMWREKNQVEHGQKNREEGRENPEECGKKGPGPIQDR